MFHREAEAQRHRRARIRHDRKGGVVESNYSQVGEKLGVHASQVSRICRGEFRTLSQNVVRVCSTLSLSIAGFIDAERADPAAALLISGVMAV